MDDKRSAAIIMLMQRLHVDDMIGHVLRSGIWTHLDLPAISSEATRIQVGPNRFYNRCADEVLDPEREPRDVLDALREQMGSAVFQAQYLQRPVAPEGNLVKLEWFRRWTILPQRTNGAKIVQSWDTAMKSNEFNDFSVGITALVRGDEIAILDVVRARLEYPELKKRVLEEKRRWKADIVLIEDKGSGTSLIQDLRRDFVSAKPIKPEGDKMMRMFTCCARIEAGCILLPERAPWLNEFTTELLAFPSCVHDDQVDALSQLINWTRSRSTFTLENL